MRKLICLCLCLLPFVGAAQDTLYYQGWEDEPGANGLHGFEQYNNQTWAQQNVWARQGFTGINAGQASTFRLLNPNPFSDCSDSRFDSCVVADAANYAGANGAHIITGAITNVNTAQFNRRHTGYHTGPWSPQPLGSEGQTAATNVGLYSPKMSNNTDYTQVVVEFYFKVNGELNRDYGLFKYSLNGEDPLPPLQDGAENQSAPQDYWTTYEFPELSVAELPYPIWTPDGDTIRFATINPVGSTVPGQLQGYVYPPGDPRSGNAMWMKATVALPAECAGNPNLRFGFWWVNDNNGSNAQTAFPALIVDDVRVIGYKFSASSIEENIYCPGDPVSVPFRVGEDFYHENIEGRETDFYAILTDSTGSFQNPDTLGSLSVSQLEYDAEEGVYYGVINGRMPVNVPQLPIGGYRTRVVSPASGYESSVSPTILTILPAPDYSINPKDTTICQGDSVMLMIDEFADTYIWKRGEQIVKETYEPFFVAKTSGNYTADVIINGCRAYADTSHVTVIPFADVSLNLPEDVKEICYAVNVDPLTGGQPEGGTYFWYYEGGNGEEVRVTGNTFNSIRAGVGDHAIGYIYTDTTTGCSTTDIDTLTVLPAVVGEIEGEDSVGLCVGQTVTLTASAEDAEGYFWSNGETTRSITVRLPGPYYVDLLHPNGCLFRTETVTVVAIPNKPAPPTLNEDLEVGSTVVSGTSFLVPLRTSFVYVYVNDELAGETLVNPDGTWSFTLTTPLEAGDRVYARVIYDTNCDGRVDGNDILSNPSITVLIIPDGPIRVPNGFSPNNDGINDVWVAVIAIEQRFPNAEMYVFNRWGNEVFYQKGYDNTWDGGNVPDGTYYYVLKLNDPRYQEPFKGYVTISR